MNVENRFWVCECGAQTPIGREHFCSAQGQRLAAELMSDMIAGKLHVVENGEYRQVDVTCESGIGLLWLYRIAFRIQQRISGLERYKDRAELARRACGLLDPLEEYVHEKLGGNGKL